MTTWSQRGDPEVNGYGILAAAKAHRLGERTRARGNDGGTDDRAAVASGVAKASPSRIEEYPVLRLQLLCLAGAVCAYGCTLTGNDPCQWLTVRYRK
jgi:hypothetical protein